MVLCDALRLCDHPEDEDAVEGILMKLFKPPRVSVQAAEEDYAAKFRTWGLASVPALELATVANMVAAGVPIGHALTLHSAIHVKQQVQVQQQNTDTTPAQPRQNTRAASVAEFPGLGELGWPTQTSWRGWSPLFTAHCRSRIDPQIHAAMRAVIKDPAADVQEWQDTDENRTLWNEFINAGTGMPERMLMQLPEDIVADEDGLGAIAHTISHLESISDDAAEVVTEWLGTPPVLTEGRKHLLKETLAEWRRMVRKAAAMGTQLSEIQQRLSLRKMTARLSAVEPKWSALGAVAKTGTEPSVVDILKMLDGLAAKYVSVRSTQQESARLAAYFAGAGGEGKGKGAGKGGRKKANGMCWAWQKGSCTRGAGCRSRHGEADAAAGVSPVTDSPTDACIDVGVATGLLARSLVVDGFTYSDMARGAVNAVPGDTVAGVATGAALGLGSGSATAVLLCDGGACGDERGCVCLDPKSVPGTPSNTTQAAPTPSAAPSTAPVSDEEKARFAAYLLELTKGMAADAGLSAGVVMSCVFDIVQRRSRSDSSGIPGLMKGMLNIPVDKGTALTVGVITDTGATIKGAGARHEGMLVNVGPMSCPVSVATAVGDTVLDRAGDLPMAGGLVGAMDGAMLLESCADSIMPVVPTCEQLDLGYQISQGGGSARFYRNGETVQPLRKEGSLFTAPVSGSHCDFMGIQFIPEYCNTRIPVDWIDANGRLKVRGGRK